MKREIGICWCAPGSTPEWVLCTPLHIPPFVPPPRHPFFVEPVAFRSEGDLISQRCQLGHSGDKREYRDRYISDCGILDIEKEKAGDIFRVFRVGVSGGCGI
ncbi:hypothetical protein CEXT_397271 [Caerostris extrusa]|uniref:Uncharacterized protein n=1 Tax=Caerostris extrusa TaxID=172846 RepID=A0AAV4XF16_CAEEX|nr:hypothetical protein CEXT_397271 [Caerostris extrusa]